MKVAILSRGRTLYSTRRIAEVSRKRGHDTRILDPRRCSILLEESGPVVEHDGLRMSAFDVVIPRFGSLSRELGFTLVHQFEATGTRTLNSALGLAISGHKFRTLQHLALADLPIPTTARPSPTDDIGRLVDRLSGPPIILKLEQGTQGVGVIKADSVESAQSTLQALWSVGEEPLLQEWIGESAGTDVRCFVVGDRVVGAMKRVAQPGDFRSNLHRGGEPIAIDLDAQTQEMAVRAAHELGLCVAGVDLLTADRGYLVIEVNASPGLEGIERATGRDIARDIIRLAEG
ncbi:MAG: ATP-grasp domain-containing protein [Myxococcota bacterium]